jgi:hypothetical protein
MRRPTKDDDQPRLHSDHPEPLRTEANHLPALSAQEAAAMGLQTPKRLRGVPSDREVIYGELDGTPENEDQADLHRAEPGEHR